MASTTYIDGTTVIYAVWLNDVNTATYTTVPALVASSSTYLVKTNNLSDVANAATARTNLGAQATLGYTAANDSLVVHLAGTETITGAKTFSTAPVFASAPAVTTAQSMVRLNTANGYGSSSTVIRRFTNTVTNQGADVTYADSASLGATFTINTNGVYAIMYSDVFGVAESIGITLNDTNLTAIISSSAASAILSVNASTTANYPTLASWTGYLPSGSVIRANGGGSGASTPYMYCQFTIVRVA